MKIFFYTLRPYDELDYCEQPAPEDRHRLRLDRRRPQPGQPAPGAGVRRRQHQPLRDDAGIPSKPSPKWGSNTCPAAASATTTIPLDAAKRLGLRVSHSHYPPEGVANYTIMLMLMATRKMNQIMLRAAAQDYSLQGKMGRDLSNCTVGVGRRGQDRPHRAAPSGRGSAAACSPTTSTRSRKRASRPNTSAWIRCTPKATSSHCISTPRRTTATSSTRRPSQK